jgi:hypothetical protein
MTAYFRTIEPRRGRVFAELKIKHLSAFPVPRDVVESDGCDAINQMGRERIQLAKQVAKASNSSPRSRLMIRLDQRIECEVRRLLGVEAEMDFESSLTHEVDQCPRQ